MKVNQSEKALKIYLLAYRSVHTPEEFEKIQEDLKAEDSVKKRNCQSSGTVYQPPGAEDCTRRD